MITGIAAPANNRAVAADGDTASPVTAARRRRTAALGAH